MGDSLVALTVVYIGRHRMTLTYPVLNGARKVLWLVTGAGKTQMLQRLLAGDPTIPAATATVCPPAWICCASMA